MGSILLNPNATDTDGDGLPDGQELFVKSVKTPKRYPTRDQMSAYTDPLDLGLAVPAWAIARVDAMVGLTHEDMGQLDVYLYRTAGPVGSFDRYVRLRAAGSDAGQANNFTSYELLQRPALSGDWLTPEDLVTSGRTWYLQAFDSTVGRKGQIEYVQIQVTVRTLPNVADTDGDGLNEREQLVHESDGLST